MAISVGLSLDELLAKAAEMIDKYEWRAAAETYELAFNELPPEKGPLEAARVAELVGKGYFKAAFQSETRDEFKNRMQRGAAFYEKAVGLYESSGSDGFAKRANARGLFSTFWVTDAADARRNILESCIKSSEEATRIFEDQREKQGLAEAHLDLVNYLRESFWLSTEWKQLNHVAETGQQISEKAIKEFEALGKDEGLLESLHAANWFLTFVAQYGTEPSKFETLDKRCEEITSQLANLSKKVGTTYAASLADEAAGWGADAREALGFFEAGIPLSGKLRDAYLTGRLYVGGAITAFWSFDEDLDRRRELLERVASYVLAAISYLEIPFHGDLLGLAHFWYAESQTAFAHNVETEIEKKRTYLRKAIEIARKGKEVKRHFGRILPPAHALSKALHLLAMLETEDAEKKRLLKEALSEREETVRIADVLTPHAWDRGVMHNYQALIKAELSKVEEGPKVKILLLEEAAQEAQQGFRTCEHVALASSSPLSRDFMGPLAGYAEWQGDVLEQLYRLKAEPSVSERALKAYRDAISYYAKAGHVATIGPVKWKIARIYDSIGDYKAASEDFAKAAEAYRLGATKVPGLTTALQELASYMDGWAMIEEARVRHNEERYGQASENYSKVASLLKETRTWSHLAGHYAACSFLEQGEALAREEKQEQAVRLFSKAANAFQDSASELESIIQAALHGSQERQDLENWLNISTGRLRYCLGRTDLEEAKLLDKSGDEEGCLRKYKAAAQTLKALLSETPSIQSRSEIETLEHFCEAWAKMKEAEAKASPKLYAEAADIFTKVEEITAKKKLRALALANSSICRSLEAGTRFRRTRDTKLYSEIKKELETATDYYQEAGLENAADWARATGKLFDALVYMVDAATERETKRKTELYYLAEKHLDLSAKLYGKAGFLSKRDEALKHLERAREEKQLLLTPMEALAESSAVTASAVTPVSLVRDQAVGVERFEAANVVGNLSVPGQLGVGSDLTLELEMANVGKTAATLIKLENLVPEGLELDRGKVPLPAQGNFIDMKGKRLEYLKTHEVKVWLKAKRKGTFQLRPRILYADERGNYRSYEFEPASFTVTELGISGWLKGPK